MTTTTDEGHRPLTVDETAAALGLSAKTIRRRIEDGTIRAVPIGPAVRVPRSEVERLQGLETVFVPDRWLVQARSKHGGKLHGFIALKPMAFASRQVQAGDILAADEETPALERLIAHGAVAELPLDSGVLALVVGYRARAERATAIIEKANLRAYDRESGVEVDIEQLLRPTDV